MFLTKIPIFLDFPIPYTEISLFFFEILPSLVLCTILFSEMPLIQFRTIDQQTFQLDVNEDANVAQIKAQIAKEKGESFPVEGQRLILNGKVLEDGQRVAELQVEPPKFIVVMSVRVRKFLNIKCYKLI